MLHTTSSLQTVSKMETLSISFSTTKSYKPLQIHLYDVISNIYHTALLALQFIIIIIVSQPSVIVHTSHIKLYFKMLVIRHGRWLLYHRTISCNFSILHCDKLHLDNKHGNDVINNNDTYMYLQYISTIVACISTLKLEKS